MKHAGVGGGLCKPSKQESGSPPSPPRSWSLNSFPKRKIDIICTCPMHFTLALESRRAVISNTELINHSALEIREFLHYCLLYCRAAFFGWAVTFDRGNLHFRSSIGISVKGRQLDFRGLLISEFHSKCVV